MPDDRTTDFEEWLETEGPESYDEARQLRSAILAEDDRGKFEIEWDYDYLMVRNTGGTGLIIASDEAKALFLQMLWHRYGKPLG